MTETEKCYVCGGDNKWNPWNETCDDCMHPEVPVETWYYDGPGDEPGWQDTTFPNER